MTEAKSDFLLLGPSGSGKTLLAKSLQFYCAHSRCWNASELISSVPTVGVNLFTLARKRRKEITVRELGGAISNLWRNFFSTVTHVIFVVDGADPLSVSSATVLLHSCLQDQRLVGSKILVVLSKSDLAAFPSNSRVVKDMMAVEQLKTTRLVTTVDSFSSLSGDGLPEVLKWLEQISPD